MENLPEGIFDGSVLKARLGLDDSFILFEGISDGKLLGYNDGDDDRVDPIHSPIFPNALGCFVGALGSGSLLDGTKEDP
jgi:hypothetical protein